MGWLVARCCTIFCVIFYVTFCTHSVAADFPPEGAMPLTVPFYLEAQRKGLVQILIMPNVQESYVQAVPILTALKPLLVNEKIQAMASGITYGFLQLKKVNLENGVTLRFDEGLVAIVATIPAENKKQQALRARYEFDPTMKTITPPSPLSAYLNLHGSQDYVERAATEQQSGKRPLFLSADGAVNLHGWVLESSANYIENDPTRSWTRGDTRVVHDFPDRMIRVAGGDLSYPVEGFQSFQSMLGVTLARDFTLQPYRITEPTGQTSFFLKAPSRVDVFVNEQKVRTLQLDAGPYDLKDFPVVNGSNAVTLVITDPSGRVEIKTLDIVSDVNLLSAGLHKYAYSTGVASRSDSQGKKYTGSAPVLSAFHRYGFTDTLTMGANLQASQDQQMGGIDVTIGNPWGVVRADLAESHVSNTGTNGAGNGHAWRLQYQLTDHAKIPDHGAFKGTRNFSLSASYRDRNFAPLSVGITSPNNASSYELAARYGQQWSPTLNLGIGGNYRVFRDAQPNDWGISFFMNKRLSQAVHLGMNLGRRQEKGYGIFMTLSWTPQGSRSAVNSSYDSFTHTARTDWNYAQDGRAESLSASASIVRTSERAATNGNIAYYGNQGEIAVRHDLITPRDNTHSTESRSQLRFGTALLFSDGYMVMSRPVSNSFALFVPTAAIEKYPIGINPRHRPDQASDYEAKTSGPRPAVIPDITPYLYRSFRIDASRLPPGFDAGESIYTLYPGYRSGTVVHLGSDANVLLDGTLLFQDKTPAALQGGSIESITTPDALPQVFFTNRAGRFRIDKLKPGQYMMQLFGMPGAKLAITVPENAVGPTSIGVLVLPITAEP